MKTSVLAKTPLVLMILDGIGIEENIKGNAYLAANTPNLDKIESEYPSTELHACGVCVGLPKGQMGNSEVGHLNMGAGRTVYQEITRINKSIEEGTFFENKAFRNAVENAKNRKSSLHLMGVLSDGGVHSHIEHLFALLELAKNSGLDKVYVHCFLDGRDVPPKSSITYIRELENKITELGVGKIATVMGRYYPMDRDKRWERVEKAYNAMALGEGVKAETAEEAVKKSYEEGVTDEFIVPTIIRTKDDNTDVRIKNGDSVIFFNFRADRARQITHAFLDDDFSEFERKNGKLDLYFVCMTEYEKNINADTAFPPLEITNTLGEVLAENNLKQLRIAETEKYAHVTFFFNGGVETENPGEDRILIPSPDDVETYNLKPEMSSREVTDTVIEKILSREYHVIILNYANPDMVGHTGDFDAAVAAVEALDSCVGKVIESVKKLDGCALITSDHGNCEKMLDEEGKPFTAHTNCQVFLMVVGLDNIELAAEGTLIDIAPTILDILQLEKPKEMTGKSLIYWKNRK